MLNIKCNKQELERPYMFSYIWHLDLKLCMCVYHKTRYRSERGEMFKGEELVEHV